MLTHDGGAPTTVAANQVVLLYDGTCGPCTSTAHWGARLDWGGHVVWLPSQVPGVEETTHLTRAQLDAAAWAIRPSGERVAGDEAIAAGLDAMLWGGRPVLLALVRLPGVRAVTRRGYAWLAANRHRFPGYPACGLNKPALPPLPTAVAEVLERRAAQATADA
jgi:predicted DCC family thiol-disulfide oxidoreductase YuxK